MQNERLTWAPAFNQFVLISKPFFFFLPFIRFMYFHDFPFNFFSDTLPSFLYPFIRPFFRSFKQGDELIHYCKYDSMDRTKLIKVCLNSLHLNTRLMFLCVKIFYAASEKKAKLYFQTHVALLLNMLKTCIHSYL